MVSGFARNVIYVISNNCVLDQGRVRIRIQIVKIILSREVIINSDKINSWAIKGIFKKKINACISISYHKKRNYFISKMSCSVDTVAYKIC